MATKRGATVKPRNSGQWTEARYNSFVKSALRSARWPPKYDALKASATKKKTNKLTGRLAMHYLCAGCGEEFPAKQVAVDHIEPVIDPALGFQGWDNLIERLYVELSGLQVLCKEGCHAVKTQQEREIANARRQHEKSK